MSVTTTSTSGGFLNATEPPLFGRVTPWSSQLAIVFGLYSVVTLVCCIVFFVGRARKIKRLSRNSEAIFPADEEEGEGQALLTLSREEGDESLSRSSNSSNNDDEKLAPVDDLGPANVCVFLWRLITMGSAEIQRKCGADAAHYLRFEKYVLLVLSISTVFGLCVLLPVNLSGSGISVGDGSSFEQTTALNLGLGDAKLWTVVVSVLLNSLLIYGLVLWLFRVQAFGGWRVPSLSVKDFSIHISGFPKTCLDQALLKEFFQETLGSRVHAAVIAPDLSGLRSVHKRAKKVLVALERANAWNAANAPKRMKKGCCSRGGGGGRMDEDDEVRRLEGEREVLRRELEAKAAVQKGAGHAFVTFERLACVRQWVGYFATRGAFRTPEERDSKFKELGVEQWKVEAAPRPRDILHANLPAGMLERGVRAAVIGVFLALAMIFFTTPISLIAAVSSVAHANILSSLSVRLAQIFAFFGDANTFYGLASSTLMLVFTTLVPRLLMRSARIERHHTRSHTEMSVVRKIFAYLFLCIIVMPAIFMTSVDVLLKIALTDSNGGWQLLRDLGGVFPRAVFFVNYLLAIGLMSNFFELLNFPGSLVGWWRERRALTAYERRKARKTAKAKFQLGYEYAYQMVLLSMTLLFSSVVPVLVPFALFAFLTKHLVDRQNLFYVYSHPHTNTRIVRLVLAQIVLGLAFYQTAMFSFFLFNKEDRVKAILCGLLLVPSVVVGIYVRFWAVSQKKLTRYDFDEENIFLTQDMAEQESYADPILSHDVVGSFYNQHL